MGRLSPTCKLPAVPSWPEALRPEQEQEDAGTATGLPTESGSSRQAVRPAPCAHARLQVAPLSCGHLAPAQGSRLRRTTLRRTNQREHREGWELGAIQGLREFSRVRGAGEHHGFRPPTLPEGQGGLHPGARACLQGCCRVLPDTSPKPVSAQTEGAGGVNRALPHTPDLPTCSCSNSLGQWPASPLAPIGLPKPPAHTAYAEATST